MESVSMEIVAIPSEEIVPDLSSDAQHVKTSESGECSKPPMEDVEEKIDTNGTPEKDGGCEVPTDDNDPKLGMEFGSEQEGYDFYNEYARIVGFTIRKEWAKKKGDLIILRCFCCTKGGKVKHDPRRVHVKNPRTIKVDCKARMVIKLQENGKYAIFRFEKAHNHEVTPAANLVESGTNEASECENVGSELTNYLPSKRMQSLNIGAAGYILHHLQAMHAENPGFVYAIQLDREEKVTNIFWADSMMVSDYTVFGDVICFDTTYKGNLDLPFALFVGVNHHKQSIVFGATLMYDETVKSFEWVFKEFLKAMNGKEPKTILSDQNNTMTKAISKVFPNAYHRVCVWHIYQNGTNHLSHVFSEFKSFSTDFGGCLFDYEDESDFLDAWKSMLDKYQLHDDTWLQQLFEEKEKWALVYGREAFCADMKSIQCSESANATFRNYLSDKHDLLSFFEHFYMLVEDRRNVELEADSKMSQSIPAMRLNVPILNNARFVYTPEIFKLFEDEFVMGLRCVYKIVNEVETLVSYEVKNMERSHDYIVRYDFKDHTISCSCKKFEFVGILCGHALRILHVVCLPMIPDQYFLKRWRRDAKGKNVRATRLCATPEEKVKFSQRYKELMYAGIKLFKLAAENEETKAIALQVMNAAQHF